MADLEFTKKTTGVIDLGNDNLAAFVSRSIDGRYIFIGGFDKKLLVIEEATSMNVKEL